MTKQEIYNELKADGEKLKAINFISEEKLVEIYVERFGRKPGEKPPVEQNKEVKAEKKSEPVVSPVSAPVPERIPVLRFMDSGWCPELRRSYFAGNYRPATVEEYRILRKYAASEV